MIRIKNIALIVLAMVALIIPVAKAIDLNTVALYGYSTPADAEEFGYMAETLWEDLRTKKKAKPTVNRRVEIEQVDDIIVTESDIIDL